VMAPVKAGVIADFILKNLSLSRSLSSVPCIKSFKPSFTAYLNKLNRLDNLYVLHSIIVMLCVKL